MAESDPTLVDGSCSSPQELRAFLAGQLSSQRTDEVAAHVEVCTNCQQQLEALDDSAVSVNTAAAHASELPFAEESQCEQAVEAAARNSAASPRTGVGTSLLPPHVGEFELLGPLGEGGMGTVYKARHASLGTTYAVKLLHPRRQADRATIERFQREMVALGRLDHANIVRAVDAGEEAGVHYLVMEYIDGVDLARAVQARGPLSIANACEAVRQAATGLAYVHQQGRVHRDVKPSNLMVASDGTVKLLDLGLARVEEYALDEPAGATDDVLGVGSTMNLTRTHQVMGTLEYMAPEQASDSSSVDEKADLYSLGCTLYKLLTGHSPFASDESVTAMSQLLAHVEQPAPPVRDHRPDVSEELENLLGRLLAKKRQDRPESAEQVAAELAPFAAGADLSGLAVINQSETARDTKDGTSKTVVLPSSHDRFEESTRRFPWGAVLLGTAGLVLVLGCPVGMGIWLWNARDGFSNAPPSMTADQLVLQQQFPDERLMTVGSGTIYDPVDLLTLLDPQRDIRRNDWQLVDDGALVSDAAAPSMLQFPYRPSDHYRWDATVERLQNEESLEIGLVAGEDPLIILVDGYPGRGPYSGIYRLNGQNVTQHREMVYRGQVLPHRRPVRLTAWVRHQEGLVHVRLDADGREIFSWRGPTQRSRGTGNFLPAEPGVLFLGNWTAALRVSDVQVTPLDGGGEVVQFAHPVEDAELAAAQRALWKGGVVTIAQGEDVHDVSSLSELSGTIRVHGIDMQRSQWLNDGDMLYFAGLPEIRRLDLSGTAVSEFGLRMLGPLPALAELSLAGTEIRRDYAELSADYPALENLNLAATGIATDTFVSLADLSNLSRLDLSGTKVTDEGLQQLDGFERLQVLNLSRTIVSDASLEHLPSMPELKWLSVSGTQVREVAGITVEKFPSLAQIQLLDAEVSLGSIARLRKTFENLELLTGTDTTDLLSLIDPQRDGYQGKWEWSDDGEALRIPEFNPARLAIPVTLPDEFDLEVVAVNNRNGEGHGPVFGLPLPGGGRPLVGFDHWPGDRNGPYTILHGIDGTMERNSPAKLQRDVFVDSTPVRLAVHVRADGIWVEQEGEMILDWRGDVSQIAATTVWFTSDLQRPTIGLYNSDYNILELKLTPVTGRIGLPPADATYGERTSGTARPVAAGGGRTIDLTDRGVTDETLPLALQGVPPQRLILEGPGITDASMPLVSSLPDLQRLELRRTRVTNDGLAHLVSCTALSRLEMWNMPQITGDVTEHIAAIPNLDRVVFKSTGVYGPGLERLHGTGLTGFYIGNSRLDGEMLEQYILPFGSLNELDLAGSSITDDDVELLTQMELNQYLHLGYNQNVTGPGLRYVADSLGVTRLILDASGVDNAGLEYLRGAPRVERLYLRNTAVTDAAAEAIASLPILSEVSVSDTQFTAEGVARLRELLPGATVIAEHLDVTPGYPPLDAELIVEGGWKPSFSDTGEELVYGLAQGTGLAIINIDTRESRPLIEEGKDAAWSPRGDWIAYVREPFHNSNQEEVRIIHPDRSEPRKVADGLYPFWIDDGATLVFYSRELPGLMSFAVDETDAAPQEFRTHVPSFYCDATQDSDYLAFGFGGKVEVLELASGRVVFQHEFAGADGTGLPSFSPDGEYLAFAPFSGDERGIWVFDWRTGASVRLNESTYQAPAWSPNGSHLTFDYRERGADTRQTSVWLLDIQNQLP